MGEVAELCHCAKIVVIGASRRGMAKASVRRFNTKNLGAEFLSIVVHFYQTEQRYRAKFNPYYEYMIRSVKDKEHGIVRHNTQPTQN